MAGLKGMTGRGLGGVRAGAGRKKKESNMTQSLTTIDEQTIVELHAAVRSARERALAHLMARLDCDSLTLKKLYDARLLPPDFYALESTIVALQDKVSAVAALPAARRQAVLQLLSSNINKIAN